MLCHLYHLYPRHHLCGRAQRRGAGLQGDDAHPRGAVRHHRGLLRHPPGCAGGREVFPRAESLQLLLDDRRDRHGADVLLPLHRNGHPRHLRLLHEEGCLHRRVHRERGDLRHGHCHHGGPDDHSGGLLLLGRRPGHPAGRPGPHVHHHPEGL